MLVLGRSSSSPRTHSQQPLSAARRRSTLQPSQNDAMTGELIQHGEGLNGLLLARYSYVLGAIILLHNQKGEQRASDGQSLAQADLNNRTNVRIRGFCNGRSLRIWLPF